MSIDALKAIRGLRDAGMPADQADATAMAIALMIREPVDRAADRLLLKLGGLMIALAAIIIAAIRLWA